MIFREIDWFKSAADKIWKVEPAKSIQTIVPTGIDHDTVSDQISEFIKGNFKGHKGDDALSKAIISLHPDSNVSTEHFVKKIIRVSEKKYLSGESNAHSEEFLGDKLETVFSDLINEKFYPILIINRFHSFTKIKDKHLQPLLLGLRELEREKKVTSIIISPMNYDIIRRKLEANEEENFPFIGSPYGDNHGKIISEPLKRNDFINYATGKGLGVSKSQELFNSAVGPDKVFEIMVTKKLDNAVNLIEETALECADLFDKLFDHSNLGDNTKLLSRLVDNELSIEDRAIFRSTDLVKYFFGCDAENSFTCSSAILDCYIRYKLKRVQKHVFDRSIREVIGLDEGQEIEFKQYFFHHIKGSEPKKKTQAIALEEINGFLNSNDGTLLIGIIDGKNTVSGQPEIAGIENDDYKDDDKYCRDINRAIKNAFGQAAASLITIDITEINGKKVCRIDCRKSKVPVYCDMILYDNTEVKKINHTKVKGVPYVRTGADNEQPDTFAAWGEWLEKHFDLKGKI